MEGYDPNATPTTTFPAADLAKFTVTNQISGSSTPETQLCSNTYIMGGPGKWDRTTELKVVMNDLAGHSSVRIKFTLYKFGDWRNSSMLFTIEGKDPEVIGFN